MTDALDRQVIHGVLRGRRALRILVIVGFYGCLFLGLGLWLGAGLPFVQSRAYFVVMTLLGITAVAGGYLLRAGRCPRCQRLYAVRADGKHRNNFTSECLNCGLRIDGSNVG